MSDDETEGYSIFPFLFGPPSEEMQRAMQEARDHHQAHVLDFHHLIEEGWDSLSAEQLKVVAQWMNYLAESNEANMRTKLAFMAGSLFRKAAEKSGLCFTCNKNHDDELAKLSGQGPPDQDQQVHVSTQFQKPDGTPIQGTVAVSGPPNAEAEASFVESQRIIAEHEANLKTYRLEQDFVKGGFKCTGCGQSYPSLEDRMLKEPGIEGCSGCIHKAKFG